MAEDASAGAELTRELGGAQRAAILLMVLGEQEASKVLQHMSPDELQYLGEAMTNINDVSQHDIFNVMMTFSDDTKIKTPLDIGAYDYLKRVLKGAIGGNKNLVRITYEKLAFNNLFVSSRTEAKTLLKILLI